MTIEKLPSGSYRIRETRDGVRYSVTVKHKVTEKQAAEIIQNRVDHHNGVLTTFKDASADYIKVKSNVLSPSTIRGYTTIINNLPGWFTMVDVQDIDNWKLQKLINDYAAEHSAKSVHNVYGFVRAVIRFFIPTSDVYATLPQKPRKTHYTPSVEDVRRLLEYAYDTPYYVAVYLASLSLRRSEICALTPADLNGDRLTINKALVPSVDGYSLKETPKTAASNRTITIPHDLADRVREQGYVFNYQPQAIDQFIRRTLPKLGIPHFSVHTLRHFFASYSHELGYSDAVIQALGGWSTDAVMKSVYRHAMDETRASKQIADDFSFM